VLVAIVVATGRLSRIHRRLAEEVRDQLRAASNPAAAAGLLLPILDRSDEWQLDVVEVVLPEASLHAGRTLASVALRRVAGCSIVGIDRHGHVIANPHASERLYPGDRLLLLGAPDQVAAGTRVLTELRDEPDAPEAFGELTTDSVDIPEGGASLGTLIDLGLIARFDVQVCGIRRGGERIVMPSGKETLDPGDRVLLLGSLLRIRECRDWLVAEAIKSAPESTEPGQR
jgi:CPA2 family monovalent cation:H+ antiporter-2